MTYIELNATSHFSFLRGVSSAEDLFSAAALLGYPALGITDRNTVGGLVRGLVAAETTGVRMVAGCRLDLMDGTGLLVWPENRAGWSSLTRMLTEGKKRADRKKGEKGQCFLHWEDVEAKSDGLVAALVSGDADAETAQRLAMTADIFGKRAHLALALHYRPDDRIRLHRLAEMARHHGVRTLATGDILYDSPDKRMLQDVVTAIRNKCTIDDLGYRRERVADRHLKGPEEMERRFRDHPDAIRATRELAERCTFSLRDLSYQYPDEIVISGRTPQQALERLTREGLAAKFPGGAPVEYANLLEHELGLVGRCGYAPYFLTVNSIVSYARSQGILCQGRGSAANSMICFLLGITSIDPVKHQLLFERFISENRKEPPDIDVDFEHERREEVIQWIYRTYGENHAALTAVVSRYRTRGALRDVGKAMGLSEDIIGALSGQIWGWSNDGVDERHVQELNLDLNDPRLSLTLELARKLIGTPRHLSQHPGGFVLTRDRLDELVPIEPAAMVDRRVIEWEKDDIEELAFMKVDVLGLGMLGCMRRAFALLAEHKGISMDLGCETLQRDDEATYKMIQRADTIGTFQIESRAQMSMLPRLKPREFYDLVIQVAIVRPGPIQGDMVHPYLRRREKKEKEEYPKPELEAVLKKTLGVPLFQEQAMKVAIVGAGFTPAEADALRRSMATFKSTGGVSHFRDKMISGMIGNGYTQDFAERTFRQIEGFGSYGFPESHAASFAKIAYASSWVKCHHPEVFCAALLNAQPMGFYQPAQIVRDAEEHGVEVRPVCVNRSDWDCGLEEPPRNGEGGEAARHAGGMPEGEARLRSSRWPKHDGGGSPTGSKPTEAVQVSTPPPPRYAHRLLRSRASPSGMPPACRAASPPSPFPGGLPVRLGLRMTAGLAEKDAELILAARADGPFLSVEEVWRRSGVKRAALERLAEADAFHGLGLSRRQALWQVRGLRDRPLPLFAAAGLQETAREPEVKLRPMTQGREVVEDYSSAGLSLRGHPLAFLREELARRRIIRCADLARVKDGRRVEVAGLVLIRQRPGAGNVTFITIEDESGIANIILWQRRFEAQRRIVMAAPMIGVKGQVQREGDVIHVVADRLEDFGPLLATVGERDFPYRPGPADGARNGGYDAREKKQKAPVLPLPLPVPAEATEQKLRLKSRNFH